MSPFHLDEFTAKVQFTTSAETPSLIYKACLATGTPSNTAYVQRAVAEALARDLDIPLQDLLDKLPPNRGSSTVLFGGDRRSTNKSSRSANA